MGEAPEHTTLDRIDSSKGYFKKNCRWATIKEQNQNLRRSVRNTSGIIGVSWDNKQQKWLVLDTNSAGRGVLYYGIDFFEAACASFKRRHCK
jgi:hypothetical protein